MPPPKTEKDDVSPVTSPASAADALSSLREILETISSLPPAGFGEPTYTPHPMDRTHPNAEDGVRLVAAYYAISSSQDRSALLRLAEALAAKGHDD